MTEHRDSFYDTFEAPQFHDFKAGPVEVDDSWFDRQVVDADEALKSFGWDADDILDDDAESNSMLEEEVQHHEGEVEQAEDQYNGYASAGDEEEQEEPEQEQQEVEVPAEGMKDYITEYLDSYEPAMQEETPYEEAAEEDTSPYSGHYFKAGRESTPKRTRQFTPVKEEEDRQFALFRTPEEANGGKRRSSARRSSSHRRSSSLQLTVPRSPMLRTAKRATIRATMAESLTTEERELAKMRALRERLQQKLSAAQKRKDRVLHKPAENEEPETGRRSLTVPKPFVFRSEQRAAMRAASKKPDADDEMESKWSNTFAPMETFESSLRKSTASERRLSAQRKRLSSIQSSFRVPTEEDRAQLRRGSLTVPQPFVFRTEQRMSIRSLSKPEPTQETQAEKFQPKPFKARPLNRKILYESVGDMGVPRLVKRPLTIPVGPRLATTQRAKLRLRKRKRGDSGFDDQEQHDAEEFSTFDDEEDPYCTGKPRPSAARYALQSIDVNVNEGERFTQTGRSKRMKLTVPKSPLLATAQRATVRKSMRGGMNAHNTFGGAEEDQSFPSFSLESTKKAAPAPFRVSLTTPKPFTFRTELRASLRGNREPGLVGGNY